MFKIMSHFQFISNKTQHFFSGMNIKKVTNGNFGESVRESVRAKLIMSK